MKARFLWMFFVRASTPSFLILRWPQNRERNQKLVLVGSEEHTEEVLILRAAFVAYRADRVEEGATRPLRRKATRFLEIKPL